MKYANQVNIGLAAAGFAVLVYVFSATFWQPESVTPLQIESRELSPEVRSILQETQPFMRGATTTRLQTIERNPATLRRSSPESVRTTRSSPGAPLEKESSGQMPVWNGPPIGEALASRDDSAVVEQRTVTREQGSESFPATVMVPPSGSSGGSARSAVDPSESRTFGRTRPLPPTDSGVEVDKRDSSDGSPPPPVRSSMPPARPPQ